MNKSIHPSLLLRNCLLVTLVLALPLSGCAPKELPMPIELVLHSWVDYMPQSVMDAFTKEYGISIKYVEYESEEEPVKNIQIGNVYDLVLLNPEFISPLVEENLLKPIDYQNVPNFKNVSANFRELVFDPDNKYSIPFHWGTTGILVRTDLIDRPITSWNDLWDPAFAGKVGIWDVPRSMIPITLKALGYSANSQDLAQLEEAHRYLLKLKANAVILSGLEPSITPILESGKLEIGFGWAYDAAQAKLSNKPIEYVIPEEGTILWSDFFVIPANANNPRGAELFLNFILQPEIAGQIINESYYPVPVDGAELYVLPEILKDPAIYPDQSQIQNAEITLPISKDRKAIYDDIWASFMDGNP